MATMKSGFKFTIAVALVSGTALVAGCSSDKVTRTTTTEQSTVVPAAPTSTTTTTTSSTQQTRP